MPLWLWAVLGIGGFLVLKKAKTASTVQSAGSTSGPSFPFVIGDRVKVIGQDPNRISPDPAIGFTGTVDAIYPNPSVMEARVKFDDPTLGGDSPSVTEQHISLQIPYLQKI